MQLNFQELIRSRRGSLIIGTAYRRTLLERHQSTYSKTNLTNIGKTFNTKQRIKTLKYCMFESTSTGSASFAGNILYYIILLSIQETKYLQKRYEKLR